MAKKKTEKRTIHTDGGAYIGGNVNTGGGDVTGRDRITSVNITGDVRDSNIVTDDRNVISSGKAPISTLFAPAYEAIRQSQRSAQEKEDLTAEVQEIESAVAEPQVEEPWLARRLRALKKMAPDIAEVVLAGLSGPGAVVSTTVKKIAAKIREEGE